jgi:hypothetical protein
MLLVCYDIHNSSRHHTFRQNFQAHNSSEQLLLNLSMACLLVMCIQMDSAQFPLFHFTKRESIVTLYLQHKNVGRVLHIKQVQTGSHVGNTSPEVEAQVAFFSAIYLFLMLIIYLSLAQWPLAYILTSFVTSMHQQQPIHPATPAGQPRHPPSVSHATNHPIFF